MVFRSKIYHSLFALTLLLVFSKLILGGCYASVRVVKFEILEKGDFSGYCEEAYFVVKAEDDWIEVWERHTLVREPKEPPPSIDFSVNFVVCAFLGQCPTAGYSMDINRIWTDGERVFVEVVKHSPPDGFAVALMITYPYVLVLVERIDMAFVFCVINRDGDIVEHVLAEFPSAIFCVCTFCSLLVVVLKMELSYKDQYVKLLSVFNKKWVLILLGVLDYRMCISSPPLPLPFR